MLTIYKASAGSGKTYTLAKNYITLLLGIKQKTTDDDPKSVKYELNLQGSGPVHGRKLRYDNRHRRILAITFTHKATEEMKTRILDELKSLSAVPAPGADPKDDAAYAADLTQLYGCGREELAHAASLAYKQLVFDYQNFNVSTIDSFFQRVLRAFVRELDRQGDFTVELEENAMVEQAVGVMLDAFNSSADDTTVKYADLEKWLCDYMESLIDEGAKANFFNRRSQLYKELVKLVSRILEERFKPYEEAMGEYLKTDKLEGFVQTVDQYKRQLVQAVQERAKKVFASVPIDALHVPKTDRMETAIRDMRAGKVLKHSKNVFEDIALGKKLCNPDLSSRDIKIKDLDDAQKAEVKEFFMQAYDAYKKIWAIEPVEKSFAQLGLLKHAWEYLRQLTKENNLLLISDTNDLLRNIIGKDETPFIYERMGVDLRHFLIDEFQDTSRMQWENLLPLVQCGLDDLDDSLVIGDVKQSIYRFRNSDSTILQDGVAADCSAYSICPKGETPEENTNYRSSAEVVLFNNTLFSIIGQMAGLPSYATVEQEICDDHKAYKGHVLLNRIGKNGNKNEKTDDEVLEEMVEQIRRLVGEGKYDYKDIAILVERHSHGRTVVEHLVNMHGIPVASDEAMNLGMSFAVQLVISVLKLIDQEDSCAAEPGTGSKYLSRGQAMMALNRYQYFANRGGLAHNDALDKAMKPIANADGSISDGDLDNLVGAVREKRPSSLVGMIEAVISTLFPDPEERAGHSAYLSALQDVALGYAEQTSGSLHSFLRWWDDRSDKLAIGGSNDSNTVKVMTIHKSKGLEFPCVLIPFCKWAPTWQSTLPPVLWTQSLSSRAPEGLDVSLAPPVMLVKADSDIKMEYSPFYGDYKEEEAKAREDVINKTYVAFTRACSELIVWYYDSSQSIGGVIGEAIRKQAKDALIDERFNVRLELVDGKVEVGEPTTKQAKAIEKEQRRRERADKAMRIGYPAECRADVLKYTVVEDALEIDSDADDKGAGSPLAPKTPQQIEGIALHDIMAHIVVPADLDRAVAKAAARHRISEAQAASYSKMIKDFLDGEAARWFAPDCKAYIEQPVYVPSSDDMRRPDRVIKHPDGSVDVIDYKFTGEDDRVGDKEQKRQVRGYMDIVGRIFPGASVRGFLCYPRMGQTIEVRADEQLD